MPTKKKKYNARFPAGRIKKIMQMDDDVGKIAHGVPVVISRSVELFVNSLLQQTASITRERNAKTLSQAHFKLCILRERKFDFLKDLVKNIEDVSPEEEKKTSKSTVNLATSSNTEHNSATDHQEEARERIKNEPETDPPNLTKNERPTKRRFVDTSNIGPVFNSMNEMSNIDIQLNRDHNNYFNRSETKSEHRSSCNLVIDEAFDT